MQLEREQATFYNSETNMLSNHILFLELLLFFMCYLRLRFFVRLYF